MFLQESEDPLAGELLDFILDALEVLTHQPGIGRPVEGGLRELIISSRRSRCPCPQRWGGSSPSGPQGDGGSSTLQHLLCRIVWVVIIDYPPMELFMPAVPANIPTSLKLPSALKLQLEEDAKQMGMSLHAFMVSTLADAAQRKRLRQTFTQDSADALALMKAAGTGHALEDVRVYFSQLKDHRLGRSAPPATLQPKKMG